MKVLGLVLAITGLGAVEAMAATPEQAGTYMGTITETMQSEGAPKTKFVYMCTMTIAENDEITFSYNAALWGCGNAPINEVGGGFTSSLGANGPALTMAFRFAGARGIKGTTHNINAFSYTTGKLKLKKVI